MVNGPHDVWVERHGRLYETDVRFTDEAHLRRIINKIVSQIGRRIDESSPMVDARLPDGSRVNAIIPPLSLSGPLLTIRKFCQASGSTSTTWSGWGRSSPEAVEFLERACLRPSSTSSSPAARAPARRRCSTRCRRAIPERRAHRHDRGRGRAAAQPAPRAAARVAPANIEGEGEIAIRDLVRNSLRMRPDRIIVGEVRGAEALDMLQAMNTGHDGSLSHRPRELRRATRSRASRRWC